MAFSSAPMAVQLARLELDEALWLCAAALLVVAFPVLVLLPALLQELRLIRSAKSGWWPSRHRSSESWRNRHRVPRVAVGRRIPG